MGQVEQWWLTKKDPNICYTVNNIAYMFVVSEIKKLEYAPYRILYRFDKLCVIYKSFVNNCSTSSFYSHNYCGTVHADCFRCTNFKDTKLETVIFFFNFSGMITSS